MVGKSLYWCILIVGILPALGYIAPCAAVDMTSVVTAENPALITAKPSESESLGLGRSAYVIIDVFGFKPPENGKVAMTVKLQRNGEQLGPPVGFFPNDTEFNAQTPSEAQRFRFELPKGELERSAGDGVPLQIVLQAMGGSGQGASVKIGKATIERR